jgi:opacity protein-like surface antigen
MRRKTFLIPVIAAVLVFAASPCISQVVPSATEGKVPLTIGGGFSDFQTDFGDAGRMVGVTVWADWRLHHLPALLDGLSIEVEGRHINYARPASFPKLRQDTGLGGALYTWQHYNRFHPYAKYLIGLGSIDFPDPANPYYTHDSRVVLAPGAGVDYRAWHNVSIRADYEYQFWRAIFGSHDLNPNGVTIGATYNFGYRER